MEITIKSSLILEGADIDMQGNLVLSVPIERCMDDAMCDAQNDLHAAIKAVIDSGAILGCTTLDATEIHDDLMERMLHHVVLKSLSL